MTPVAAYLHTQEPADEHGHTVEREPPALHARCRPALAPRVGPSQKAWASAARYRQSLFHRAESSSSATSSVVSFTIMSAKQPEMRVSAYYGRSRTPQASVATPYNQEKHPTLQHLAVILLNW